MGTFLGLCLPTQAYTLETLTTNVVPLNGTGLGCDEFPGAVVPFGMVQWSPDMYPVTQAGYIYSGTQIAGFGLDHMSGAGCNYGGDFDFTPILCNVTASPCAAGGDGLDAHVSTFSHANEIAMPGYYSVQLSNGIRTELTVTTRTGFGRFTYPTGNPAGMVINACSGVSGTVDALIQINTNGQEISGWTIQNGFCGLSQRTTLYFDAVFDHPFATYGVWNGAMLTPGGTNATGNQIGVYLSFNLPGGGVVLARTAVSYVSVANAQANLAAESPASSFSSTGFDAAVNAASNVWNNHLNEIQVSGGTAADTGTFYTMMYHAFQAPSVVSDDNGQYMGFDAQTHTLAAGHAKYEFFSGWDIYRNECQFIAMMDPARAGDMAQSLILDAQECGVMPRWSVPDGDTGAMMGDPATPIIAGMYAFGATNFDTASALSAMINAATNPAVVALNGVHERDAERDYLNLGFVPEYQRGGYGSVSMTLEYCSVDCALARFALALGDTNDYTAAMNRAQNWRNLFNTSSGYLQMRRSDGLWSPGFIDDGERYDDWQAYAEATAPQYVWMVPFNLGSLIEMMGGPQQAAPRLDSFFTTLNGGIDSPEAYMGNEPCSETPWIYNYMGEPYKASSVVRQVMQLYSTTPEGLPGGDDFGQMASWYILAALGMHPEIPGDDLLVLNGPLFPQAVIHLTRGDVTITASGAGDNAPYVQSLTVNGQPHSASWIRFADIANGGTLAFTLSTTPSTNWGAALSDWPPSYSDGTTSPLAGNYCWGTGLETNETQPTWINTVDSAPYPDGGITNVGPISNGLSGPELGVRIENSQSGNNEIMYSGKALGGTSDYAYMKMFDVSAQNVTVSPGMHFSYWIFPQSYTNNSLAMGSNSAYMALNLILTDGTTLQSRGLTDQHGVLINPTSQGGILALDTWNYVTVDLTPLAGKTVSRIDLGYDQPGGSGGYRGYVDDIALTTPASWLTNNLALNQPASADSQEMGFPARNGNDRNLSTRWSAADGNAGHWWEVDLGQPCNLTGDEVSWQNNSVVYDYTVAVSADNTNWTMVVNKTANTSAAQNQADMFIAAGRYVRITVTGLPPGDWASFDEFQAFGSAMTPPSAPTLQALGGYGLVSLNWVPAAEAAGYNVERSTVSGGEVTITNVSSTNYLDNSVTNGTTYYYVVSAVNLVGQRSNLSEVNAKPEAPLRGSYAAAVVEDHPLGYWPLNETNGLVALDPVGCHNGTYIGGVILGQPGLPQTGFASPNFSVLFDGNSGHVDIPEGPFNITNAITTLIWADVPAAPGKFTGLFGHGDSSWQLGVGIDGNPSCADGGNPDVIGPFSIEDSGWHMLVYTYTGVPDVTNNGSLYVDGTLVAQNTVDTISGSGYDVWIGGSPDYGTGRFLSGRLAQAAIFTNALSTDQVQALYNAGLSRHLGR